MRFQSTKAGWVTQIRFYKGTGATGSHTGSLWTTSGQRLAAVQFTNETATGWQTATLAQPVAITANTQYVVSYTAPSGRYSQTSGFFTTARTSGLLQAPANGGSTVNGVSGAAGAYPGSGAGGANFWVDVVVTTTAPAGISPDTLRPTVVSTTPTGAGMARFGAVASAVFSEPVTGAVMTITGPDGAAVRIVSSYTGGTLTASSMPLVLLASRTTYTVTVSGARDTAGNTMAAPVSWTFTTA